MATATTKELLALTTNTQPVMLVAGVGLNDQFGCAQGGTIVDSVPGVIRIRMPQNRKAPEAEPEKARDQNEVLEICKYPDLGRDPANHQEFEEQRKQAPQSQLPPRKAPQSLRRKLPFLMPSS